MVKLLPTGRSGIEAGGGYQTTWAIGRVADDYFSSQCQMDGEALRSAFTQAKQQGNAAYQAREAEITAKQAAIEPQMRALAEELKTGRLDEEEYLVEIQYLF